MSKFIKLSTLTINTKYIVGITSTPIKHVINFHNPNISGYFFFPLGIIENGNTIDVCIHKQPNDYKIISEWISNCDL